MLYRMGTGVWSSTDNCIEALLQRDTRGQAFAATSEIKMKQFTSYSQAGQDKFVISILPEGHTFLDIGACHPIEISNTYALEQLGWRGLLVDNDPGAIKLCQEQRQSPAILADATTVHWLVEMRRAGILDDHIDYLSLDVDAASLPTLRRLPFHCVDFRVLTIETDVYRFGEVVRDEMRKIIGGYGYDLVCADVCSSEGIPYEDWYCHPSLSERAHRFRCQGKRWNDILP
jgi:hypothetical protein